MLVRSIIGLVRKGFGTGKRGSTLTLSLHTRDPKITIRILIEILQIQEALPRAHHLKMNISEKQITIPVNCPRKSHSSFILTSIIIAWILCGTNYSGVWRRGAQTQPMCSKDKREHRPRQRGLSGKSFPN